MGELPKNRTLHRRAFGFSLQTKRYPHLRKGALVKKFVKSFISSSLHEI